MKEFYIRDAAQQENKVVTTSFVVSNKQIKSKKERRAVPRSHPDGSHRNHPGQDVGQRRGVRLYL